MKNGRNNSFGRIIPRDKSIGSQLKNNSDLAAVNCRGLTGSELHLQASFDKSHFLVMTPDSEVSGKELLHR